MSLNCRTCKYGKGIDKNRCLMCEWGRERWEPIPSTPPAPDPRDELIEKMVELAENLVQWSEAYPADIWEEPTPEKVDAVCKTLGCRIDNITAMVMRRFTKPWGDKARKALVAWQKFKEEGK